MGTTLRRVPLYTMGEWAPLCAEFPPIPWWVYPECTTVVYMQGVVYPGCTGCGVYTGWYTQGVVGVYIPQGVVYPGW